MISITFDKDGKPSFNEFDGMFWDPVKLPAWEARLLTVKGALTELGRELDEL